MSRQFPTAFEFNEEFLLHIANALTSGLYGTFLYNSVVERNAYEAHKITTSVWTPVLQDVERFQNATYTKSIEPIWPWTDSPMIRLWNQYFFQWHPKNPQCRWMSTSNPQRKATALPISARSASKGINFKELQNCTYFNFHRHKPYDRSRFCSNTSSVHSKIRQIFLVIIRFQEARPLVDLLPYRRMIRS